MSRKRTLLGLGVAALVVIVAAGGAFWYLFLRDDAPEEVSLTGALASLSPSPAASGSTPAATASPARSVAADGVNGVWQVDSTVDSFVGYRVKEELATVGFTTAVGRTNDVTGTFEVDNNVAKAGSIEAKLSTLKSDQDFRDNALRTQSIETNKFPTATFKLTEDVALPEALASGQSLTTTLVGELTLHGVTKAVEIPVETTVSGEYLVVVGSIEIVFADYNIAKPSAPRVLSIEDRGIMELQLFFKR
ncbi:MAG: YceI family protein [Dehalococcoidia bacterium]